MIGSNPFTPKSGMEPKTFIGREEELELFDRILEKTVSGKPDHFLILGDWGVGKTSLLREFKKRAQEKGVLCSLVEIRPFQENEGLIDTVDYLTQEIALELPVNLDRLKTFIDQLTGIGITISGTGFDIKREPRKRDPQIFLRANLLNIWEDVKKETKAVIILLDDAQNFSNIPEIFTLLKNILIDEKITRQTKFLFVISSTFDAWVQFLQRHHPIGRFFTPRLELKNLNKKQAIELIEKTLEGTSVSFEQEIKNKIYAQTQGHPYELQILCDQLYENQMQGRVTLAQWDTAMRSTLKNLSQTVFDGLYEKASKQEKNILFIIAKAEKPLEFNEIIRKAIDEHRMQRGTTAPMLSRLLEKRLIEKPEKGRYWIADPMFRTFITENHE